MNDGTPPALLLVKAPVVTSAEKPVTGLVTAGKVLVLPSRYWIPIELLRTRLPELTVSHDFTWKVTLILPVGASHTEATLPCR